MENQVQGCRTGKIQKWRDTAKTMHIQKMIADSLPEKKIHGMTSVSYTHLDVYKRQDLDGITVGTILTVKDIPELMSDKIELKVDSEEIVLRVSERKHHVEVKEAE